MKRTLSQLPVTARLTTAHDLPALRLLRGLLVVAHLAAVGLVPMADAAHERAESAQAVLAHPGATPGHDCIGHDDSDCERGHAHRDCLLCRVLSTPGLEGAAATPDRIRPNDTHVAFLHDATTVHTPGAVAPPPARAPPLA